MDFGARNGAANNTYGIFGQTGVAEEQDLQTLADLAEASPDLRFASYSEVKNRSDGYPDMQKNYPVFDFGDIIIANQLGLCYQSIADDRANVDVGFTTDGQFDSDELTVMEGPKLARLLQKVLNGASRRRARSASPRPPRGSSAVGVDPSRSSSSVWNVSSNDK